VTGQQDAAVARFLTLGGAVVDLTTKRFVTRFADQGRPYASEPREVAGYAWLCQGCGDDGYDQHGDTGYLPEEQHKARTDANAHASTCRAMPKPEAAT
jgi:hypothetical protein